MTNANRRWTSVIAGAAAIPLFCFLTLLAQSPGRPLVLQEMSWRDVQDHLKASDMVIIPIGSTEQHDPRQATREIGEKIIGRQVENAVKFIEAWKQAKSKS